MRHANYLGSLLLVALTSQAGCGDPAAPMAPTSPTSPTGPTLPTGPGMPTLDPQPITQFTIGTAGTHFVVGPEHTSASQYYGLTVDVPAGAVPGDVHVTLSTQSSLAGADETAVGPAVLLGPAELRLQKPAQLTLPYDPTQISYLNDLRVVVGGVHQDLSNPLRRVVIGRGQTPPFQVSSDSFGAFQALAVKPRPPVVPDPDSITKIDILFVVDNSSSMALKQAAVIGKFRSFIQKILKCHVNLHIGVINTDLGIVPGGQGTWPGSNDKACDTEVGDNGHLQNTTCIDSGALPADDKHNRNDANCALACKHNTKLKAGEKFLSIDMTMGTSNLDKGGVDLDDITDAFGCLAYQGESGCGIEMPFEAASRALANADHYNDGFLQSNPMYPDNKMQDSVQLLVFITDEDDCSVRERDQTDPAGTMPYVMGAPVPMNFGHNFRCFAMSTVCAETLTMDGTKTMCKPPMPAMPVPDANYLEDIDVFNPKTKRSGLAQALAGNRKMLIGGVWPLNPTDSDRAPMEYGPNPAGEVNLQYMVPTAQSQMIDFQRRDCSKIAGLPPNGGAAAQHRLSELADNQAFLGSYQTDICDPDGYDDVLSILADALKAGMKKTCS